jgi:hypothetical protein
MAFFQATFSEAGGKSLVNDKRYYLVEADNLATARAMVDAESEADGSWADVTPVDVSTLSAADYEGFRYVVTVSGDPAVNGDPDLYTAEYTGIASDTLDLVGAGLAAALEAVYLSTLDAAIADDGGVFTDETTAANEATANDMTLLPAVPVASDGYYFGSAQQFRRLDVNVSTVGTGTYTLAYEYWNGSIWTSLTVVDGTTNFKSSGVNTITFTPPGDWAATTVNSQGPFFYIRNRVDAGTTTAIPLGQIASTHIGQALYTSGTDTLTAATIADGIGDHVLVVEAFPPGGAAPVPQLVSTIVDEGIAAAVLTVVLAGPTAIPKIVGSA